LIDATGQAMKERILNHWKAKIASLLVAVAVWYLLKGHVGNQQDQRIVSDPGTPIASASVGSGWSGEAAWGFGGGGLVMSSAMVAAELPQVTLIRLHWVESGEFSAGVTEFPGYPCA